MDSGDKRIIAAIGMAVVFVGFWMSAGYGGYVVYRSSLDVFWFLSFTVILWIAEVFLGELKKEPFSFGDHGFQLTIISFVGLVTLQSSAQLGQYKNEALQTGMGFVMFFLICVLFIYSKYKKPPAPMPPLARAFSLAFGVFAAQAYIAVALSGSVTAWKFF